MHGTKSGVEIKGNIEIVLLILILVIAAVGALYYYAQKEPQRANQEMPLVTPTPPPSVNKATTTVEDRETTGSTPRDKNSFAGEKEAGCRISSPCSSKIKQRRAAF